MEVRDISGVRGGPLFSEGGIAAAVSVTFREQNMLGLAGDSRSHLQQLQVQELCKRVARKVSSHAVLTMSTVAAQ